MNVHNLGDMTHFIVVANVVSVFFNHGGRAEVTRRSTEKAPPWTSVLPRLFLRG